jgi:long-chain acyl-CoA synthetase
MMYAHSIGRALRNFPTRSALISEADHVTFRELHDRVASVARAFRCAGFSSGDRLAILLPNGPAYVELIYACIWLGVVVIPLNTRLSAVELQSILASANPKGLVRHSSFPAVTTRIPWQRAIDEEPLDISDGVVPKPIDDPQATLALLYTSGTTGSPKGVVITHENILADILHLNYWLPYGEGDVHLHAAPMFHIIDFPLLFAAAASGACQVAIPKFTPEAFCETVERARVTHTLLVPTMISSLTQFAGARKYDLSSLKHLAYGGSPMHHDLIQRTRELLPDAKLMQGYGLSETGVVTGLLDHEHIGGRLASCGRTCPGIEMCIVDELGNEVPPGSHGELVARGANVMRGYLDNPKENAIAFRNGMLRTGDIGYQDAQGYFYILDRSKDMIVTGGENVYCGEVEAILHKHPAVSEAAVFGIPDPQWGELVAASIVPKSGMTPTAESLVAHCRRFLANYKTPRYIDFWNSELPKSGTGKVLKRSLRERYWAHQQRAVS